MLDAFLEVACGQIKQAEAKTSLQDLLNKLPSVELMKIADGCPPSTSKAAGDCGWLDQFRGSPLLDQAIEIERAEIEAQMEENERRRAQAEMNASLPSWDETDMKRQEIQIKRKLLELELAGASLGGQEGEDMVPPDPEEVVQEEATQAPAPAPEEAAVAQMAAEEPPAAEGNPFAGGEKPKAEKPKTEKVTKETTEKPVPEKIDVKAASARMRFSMAAQAIKEAQPATRARAFQPEKVANAAALGALALAGGAGVLGHHRGRAMANRDEEMNLPLNAAAGLLLPVPGTLPYVVGKAIGHSGRRNEIEEAAMAEKGASVVKAKGSIGRGLQLLTGSRARSLEGQAANRAGTMARNVKSGDKIFKNSVFHDLGERNIPMPSAHSDEKAHHALHISERAIRGSHKSSGRATREATKERLAVGGARRDAGRALLGGAAGVGGGAFALSGNNKTAGITTGLASTVAAGSKKIRSATEAVQQQVAKNNTPLLSRNQKLVGGGIGAGLGVGALARKDKPKTASISAEREEQIKQAFGAAVLQGLKGIGQFAGAAGRSVAGAARAGGVQAAGQAAANAGRAGMMGATNFMAKNPAAGAALVAAPAAAVGYAAGRQ